MVLPLKRLVRLAFGCPRCRAPAGVSCIRANGAERKANHRERYRTIKSAEGRIALARVAGNPSDPFYRSRAWRIARFEALKKSSGRCELCGALPGLSGPLHVDHIKPRSRFPDLALTISNLQVMCADCNKGKRASDTTDWRSKPNKFKASTP